jgi:hypothetical protein
MDSFGDFKYIAHDWLKYVLQPLTISLRNLLSSLFLYLMLVLIVAEMV